jgi:hypothetical protein
MAWICFQVTSVAVADMDILKASMSEGECYDGITYTHLFALSSNPPCPFQDATRFELN